MASPEVLTMFKELNLVKMPATLSYYLGSREGGDKKKSGENSVKSFHDGPFIEFERLWVTMYKYFFR